MMGGRTAKDHGGNEEPVNLANCAGSDVGVDRVRLLANHCDGDILTGIRGVLVVR